MEIRRIQPRLLWLQELPRAHVAIAPGELAARLGVTEPTVIRWVRSQRWPRLAELAMRHVILGFLPSDRWAGWRLDTGAGVLYAPNGFDFQPAELEYRQLLHTRVQVLTRRIEDLEAELTVVRAAARARLAPRPPARCDRAIAPIGKFSRRKSA